MRTSSKYHKLYSVSSTFYSLAQFIGPPKEEEEEEDPINKLVNKLVLLAETELDNPLWNLCLEIQKQSVKGNYNLVYSLVNDLKNKIPNEKILLGIVNQIIQANAPNNMQANVPATFNAWKTWADINDILQFAKKYKFDQTLTSNLEKELNNVKSQIKQFERNPNVAANAITAAKAVCKSYKGNSVELSNLWRKLYSSSPSLVRNTWDL